MTDLEIIAAEIREAEVPMSDALAGALERLKGLRDERDSLLKRLADCRDSVGGSWHDTDLSVEAIGNPDAVPASVKEAFDSLRDENAKLLAERDHADLCFDRAVRILTGIHALLYPPRFTDQDGRTWQFKSPLAEEQMQELSDRIRALPDEIAAIDAAMQKGE